MEDLLVDLLEIYIPVICGGFILSCTLDFISFGIFKAFGLLDK